MTEPVELIIEPRERDIGGFSVRRLLPFAKRRNVGPFVFFDHLGPATFAPGQGIDVRPHPHVGLATVTWLFDGALDHRDSLGTYRTIRPGAVNWMTSGRGIVHSERTPSPDRASGHRIEAIQTWVALPLSHEDQEPDFQHYPADVLPLIRSGDAEGVLISGLAYGKQSPVKFPSGICQLTLTAISDTEIDAPEAPELCLYVVDGEASIGATRLTSGMMGIIAPGWTGKVSLKGGTRIIFAGGDALDAPRHLDWNFLTSSKERLAQAAANWRASIAGGFSGTHFTQPPGETAWIPLPGDPQPPGMDHIPDDHDADWES